MGATGKAGTWLGNLLGVLAFLSAGGVALGPDGKRIVRAGSPLSVPFAFLWKNVAPSDSSCQFCPVCHMVGFCFVLFLITLGGKEYLPPGIVKVQREKQTP